MVKLILFLLLFVAVQARDFWGRGEVKIYSRTGDFWRGQPEYIYISVLNDSQYLYLIIPDKSTPLRLYIGKNVEFHGKIWTDSTTLKDGLKHTYIKDIDYTFIK